MSYVSRTSWFALISTALCLPFFGGLRLLSQAAAASQSTKQQATLERLRAGFANPPPEARLRCYWWWLNGNTDKPTITHDLEEMKAKGFGGALLVDANGANQNGNVPVPAGPTFGSPAWVDLYTHALREADRLGLEITLNITSGWNLGGPDTKPDQASKILTWTRTLAEGGQHLEIKLAAPNARNGYYREIAVLAYPLRHGARLAAQPDDSQGDRHTAESEAASTPDQTVAARDLQSARTLRFRSVAAETGFSMPDASAMLNDGITREFAGEPQFADALFGEVRDVSTQVQADGTLRWDAPQGKWEFLRVGYTDSDARVSTSSGTWQGLAIDYMSRDAFEQYWNHTVEPLLTAAKPFHSLKYLASDSWELGGENWTQKFREQFIALRGYDPIPWLPVVAGRIIGDRGLSTRFLTDMRRTVADLIVSEHYDIFATKAQEHGLGVEAESGGPHGAPIDALETFRHAAVPQTEFWSENAHRSKDEERFFTKEGSSAAHIYGQRFVAQEGETSIGPQWSERLATDLKPSFDMAITEGMNRLVWHEFTSSPESTGLPGQEYFAGTHLNPKVTWWNAGGAFFTYLNRVQYLMQQGVPVADLLYFYGDNVPNFVRLKADDPAHVLPGYDYDVTNEDALLHTISMENGRLIGPADVSWRAFVMPKTGRVSLAVLKLLDVYVREGGAVIGLPPDSMTGMQSLEAQAQFKMLKEGIWGADCKAGETRSYGRGTVFCTADAHAALALMHIPPDAEWQSAASDTPKASYHSPFDFVHRKIDGMDLYFTRNGSDHAMRGVVNFRASKGIPQLWDPVSGSITQVLGSRKLHDGRIAVPFELPPHGSIFVLFPPVADHAYPVAESAGGSKEALRLLQPWQITFQRGRGIPSAPFTASDLTSWTEWKGDGIRYFSGTATYRTSVRAPNASGRKAVWLHFADVGEIARVNVNGKDAGTIWAEPFSLRVDSLLHSGVNTLEIEVTNLWANRIIGDLQPNVTEHVTTTNIKSYSINSPLLPSGLIGPAEWIVQ